METEGTEDEAPQSGPPVPARLRELPSRLLGQAASLAQRLVTEGLNGADAHKWHYAALVALDEYGPASQAGLSDRTGIHRSDLVAVLNELAARGDVERTPDPADRRRNVITLTPHGRKRLGRLEQLLRQTQEDLEAARTRYLDLYEHAPVAYLMVNMSGRIVECNSVAARLLQGSPAEFSGRPLSELILPDGLVEYAAKRDHLVAKPSGLRRERDWPKTDHFCG